VFAFGCLLWELICREVPHDGLDPIDIRSKVEKGEPLRMPYGVDPRLGQLINDCRAVAPEKRPTFEQVVKVLSDFN